MPKLSTKLAVSYRLDELKNGLASDRGSAAVPTLSFTSLR